MRELADAMGVRQAIELEVDGAFHTPLMERAGSAFAKALATMLELRSRSASMPSTIVYSNVTGLPYRSVGEVVDLLPRQISSPVRWSQVVTHASGLPVRLTSVILPSPGHQLEGMLRNQSPSLYSKRSPV